MTTDTKRESYILEFVQHLGDPENEEDTEELHKILTETMTKTLEQVENRFTMYRKRVYPGQSVRKLQKEITRAEKHINARINDKDMPGTPTAEKKFGVRHIHREALKNCYTLLTNDLDLFKTSLMDDLLASDVVSMSDKDSIWGRDTQKRQNEEFYAYLVGRITLDEFHSIFLPSLDKDHPHIAKALIKELDRLEDEYQELQCVACRARKHIQLKRLASPLLLLQAIELPMFTDLRSTGLSNTSKWAELRQVVSDADIIKAMEKKYPDFYNEFRQKGRNSMECFCPPQEPLLSVKTTYVMQTCYNPFIQRCSRTTNQSYGSRYADFIDTQEEESSGDFMSFQADEAENEYKMTACPRGICLIVNNTNFKDPYPTRLNSDADAEKLQQLFNKLQFSVVTKTNQTSCEMMETLVSYAEQDHSRFDAFVCFIMTHGTEDGLIGCDGSVLSTMDVTYPFTTSRCPTLSGKPKLFFIDAARGTRVMFDRLPGEDTEPGIDSETAPAEDADFLVGYCTPDGYVNYRSQSHGSLYVRALAKVFDSQSDQNDLLNCLLMVNREVSRYSKRLGTFNYKQVPAPVFTLTKKVHLTIDPLWPYSDDTPEKKLDLP